MTNAQWDRPTSISDTGRLSSVDWRAGLLKFNLLFKFSNFNELKIISKIHKK